MRTLVMACVAACLWPSAAAAQRLTVDAGSRVRLWAPADGLRAMKGRVHAVVPESLVVVGLMPGPDTVAIAMSAITRLQVSGGRRSNWDRGLLIGSLVGGGLGLVAGVAWSTCEGFLCPDTGGEQAGVIVVTTLGVGLAGGLLGTGIGALSSREIWWEAQIPGRSAGARVVLTALRGGRVGVGVCLGL